MPKPRGFSRRKYSFVYLAGMPAELCGGESRYTFDEVADRIVEEWAGQRESIRHALSDPRHGRGAHYKGQRFIIIRVS